MRCGSLLTVVAATATSALAAALNYNDIYNFSSELEEYYSRVGRHIDGLSELSDSACDVTKAMLPSQASQLPAVPAGQELMHVAIGRGTQV
jgi:hypothetical protein